MYDIIVLIPAVNRVFRRRRPFISHVHLHVLSNVRGRSASKYTLTSMYDVIALIPGANRVFRRRRPLIRHVTSFISRSSFSPIISLLPWKPSFAYE